MLHTTLRAAVAIPLPRRFPKGTRKHITDAIERHQDAMDGLIALLDLFDGDADLEPSLGCHLPCNANDRPAYQLLLAGGSCDLEQDVADEPHDEDDEGDKEPSLGWVGWFNQAAGLARETGYSQFDMEGEHDGREPDADFEPNNFHE